MKRPSWFAPEPPVIVDRGPERKVCAVCREDLAPFGKTEGCSYFHSEPPDRSSNWFQHNPLPITPLPGW